MLQAIWEAAAAFPEAKRDRLKPLFLDTVAKAGDDALLAGWQQRLGSVAAPQPVYADYAREQAERALDRSGWEGFLSAARSGSDPFNIGRPEVMAAGARLAPDSATRARVVSAMFEIAGSQAAGGRPGDDFERVDFGHALAELSMESCDLAAFDRASAMTPEPDGLRYAFWRARITGSAGHLAERIRDSGDEDTRFVRAAIEGYSDILSRGYCPAE